MLLAIDKYRIHCSASCLAFKPISCSSFSLSARSQELFSLNEPASNRAVGSIGVRSSGFGFQEAIKKLGIERRIYTQGENKVILDPFLPEKEYDINIISEIQKDIHHEFKEFIKSRRKGRVNIEESELFSGKFWSGKQAKKIGLVDDIGDCYQIIKKKFGDNVNIKKIQMEKSWIKRKFKIINIIDIIFDKLMMTIKENFDRNRLGM
ncbi:MAG: hypothetical protein EOP45_23435 [Sphingobacteriaceae bacterium]|nr:MAG: hypothetical protein EOP45_23435 [Sphingobacteriaceae bacterium]